MAWNADVSWRQNGRVVERQVSRVRKLSSFLAQTFASCVASVKFNTL